MVPLASRLERQLGRPFCFTMNLLQRRFVPFQIPYLIFSSCEKIPEVSGSRAFSFEMPKWKDAFLEIRLHLQDPALSIQSSQEPIGYAGVHYPIECCLLWKQEIQGNLNQVQAPKAWPRTQNDAPLNDIFQFPNIAWPVIFNQFIQLFLRESFVRFS